MDLGKLRNAFKSLLRAFKSDVPPEWWRDARQLNSLLSGAWEEVSSDFLMDIEVALRNKDFERMAELTNSVNSLGPEMSASITDKTEAIFTSVQNKALAAWTLHGREVLGVEDIKGFGTDYQEFLVNSHAEQVKKFTEINPGRILHPQIEKQIQYLREAENVISIDIDLIAERLQRIVKQEPYWEGLSDVQVARLWNADGILLAHENGVKIGVIVGPDDKKTCPVCSRMLGTHVYIQQAVDKIKSDVGITDPEEYVKAWPFPRIQDVDNISSDERAAKGYWPPYHSRCRHDVAWLAK